MLLLPVYLGLFLGNDAATLDQPGPCVHAFVWLIAAPLALAGAMQLWAARSHSGKRASAALGFLPVQANAVVWFIVVFAVLPQLGPATDAALVVIPFYLLLDRQRVGWGT